jgi:hypothetical protein
MNWEPGRGDNSIDRAIVALTLTDRVTENELDDLSVAARQIAIECSP